MLPHLHDAAPVRVQAVLDSDEGFSERLVKGFGFSTRNFSSISGSFDIKSISFKGGDELRFDIIHGTVVVVDKRLAIPRRSGALESTPHPVEDGTTAPRFGSFAYM